MDSVAIAELVDSVAGQVYLDSVVIRALVDSVAGAAYLDSVVGQAHRDIADKIILS